MPLLQRPGRPVQLVGFVVFLLGFLSALLLPGPTSTYVFMSDAYVGTPVLMWSAGETVAAVVAVLGLLVLAYGTGLARAGGASATGG